MEYWQQRNHCQPRWRDAVDDWLRTAQSALWCTTCILCKAEGESGRDLCFACERDLSLNLYACRMCAQPLAAREASGVLCGACLREPPVFDASFIPYRYSYPLDRLIHRLKYNGDLSVGRVLGELFVERLRTARKDALPNLIVPVPLAIRRFRTRGFNQAIELARTIARSSGLPMRADLVERTRETQEQAGLPRTPRRGNVRGAFRSQRSPPHSHVAIIDDVVTTGSTVNELAKVLRQAGVQKIEVWAIARAARSA